jgi:hypothetical protein
MLKNRYFYRKNFHDFVSGFIVPKEFISGCTLKTIEGILGYKSGRFKQGAAFAQLYSLPREDELEYYGDTRVPGHRFEENRNKNISRNDLSKSTYSFFQSNTKLIKVITLANENPLLSEDENWPSGSGAMQFKLKKGIRKPAIIIDVIENYPHGIFV